MTDNYMEKLYGNYDTDFEEFTLGSAKRFGSVISQIPEEYAAFEDSIKSTSAEIKAYFLRNVKYYEDQLKQVRATESSDLMDAARVSRETGIQNECEAALRVNGRRDRYLDMLEKVNVWTPPSENYAGLKRFMAKQLREQLESDHNEYIDVDALREQLEAEPLDVEGYRQSVIRSLTNSLEQANDGLAREREKSVQLEWYKDLKESFDS